KPARSCRSGIRLPAVEHPHATYTCWNFRNERIGGDEFLYPLLGSYVPFAATAAQREARRDPRPSIAERYASKEAYLERVRRSGERLVAERYLLAEDLLGIVERASRHWDLLTN